MKHVDVGEKIGGARKDYYRNPLNSTDCSAMNTSELQTHVRKANVWPAIDMEALRARGMTPHAAAFIKVIKDALPHGPQSVSRLKDESEEAYLRRCCDDYLTVVTSMRNALMDPQIRTADDALKAFGRTMKTLMNIGDEVGRRVQIQPEDVIHQAYDYKPFRRALRRVESELISAWSEKREPEMKAGVWNVLGTKVRYTTDEDDGWKSQEEALWEGLGGPTRKPQSAEAAEKRKERKEQEDELKRPHLAHVVVEGQRRDLRRHVEAEELMKEFGFRAIEFGNWLPDGERQEVLDFAYDSFDMLAEALDVPRRAIGFDGRLAIAFGSRGNSSALAHFEPLREVINLTRLKGAGCLAHEWCHAYDHFQSQGRAGIRNPEEKAFLNEKGSKLSESRKFALPMENQEYTREVFAQLAEHNLEMVATGANLSRLVSLAKKPQAAQIIMEFGKEAAKEIAAAYGKKITAILNGEELDQSAIKEMNTVISNKAQRLIEPILRLSTWPDAENAVPRSAEVLLAHPTFTKALCMKAAAQIMEENHIETIPAAAGLQFSIYSTQSTRFLKDAEKLDAGRSKTYWSTRVEMFARAGACAIYDKVTALGKRNDYLNWGVDEERYKDKAASPNTQGQDRAVMAKVFDEEFGKWREQVKTLACEPIIKTGEIRKPDPFELMPSIQRTPKPERLLSAEDVEELRTIARNLSHVNIRSGGDDMGLGGLFSEPLVLSAKLSASHYGKVVVQTLDDGNLIEGGYLGYQLLPLENFDECVKDNHLVAQGVPLSPMSVADKTEVAVDPSEESRIFIASSDQLEREINQAKKLDFEPWINNQAEEQLKAVMRQGEPVIRQQVAAARAFAEKQEKRRGRGR